MQVHRDIMDGALLTRRRSRERRRDGLDAPGARIEDGAHVDGPCFIDEGAVVKAGARIVPVRGHRPAVPRSRKARRARARSCGPTRWIGRDAVVDGAILGPQRATSAETPPSQPARVLGDKSVLTDYTQA